MPPGRRPTVVAFVGPAVALLATLLAVPAVARPAAGADNATALTLTIEPARQAVPPGRTATFTFTVTNTGPEAVHDVFLADVDVPACNAFDLGELAPGATATHHCVSPVVTEAYRHTAFAAATTGPATAGAATTDDATTDDATTDDGGRPVLALASAEVTLAADVTGRLVTAGATCAAAAAALGNGVDSAAGDVERLAYRSRRGKVTGVAPSAVTYVSAVTAAAGAMVEVRQSVVARPGAAADSVPPPLITDRSGVSLWPADCRRGGPKVRPTIVDGGVNGGTTVRLTVPEAGEYLVAVTYRTDPLINRPAPGLTPYVLVTAVDGAELARSGDALALRPRSL